MFPLQTESEYSPDLNIFQCILKGFRKFLAIAYYSPTFISYVYLIIKKCLQKFQGQIGYGHQKVKKVKKKLSGIYV